MDTRADLASLAGVARATSGLQLLMLFGSRARGDAAMGADWDIGFLGDPALDVERLMASLIAVLGTDRVDLVDLRRASGLLRYAAARDGRLIFEAIPGIDHRFRLDAATFWCDAAPVLMRGYEDVLADLKRD